MNWAGVYFGKKDKRMVMDGLTAILTILAGLGAIVIGIVLIFLLIFAWWAVIPVVCCMIFGGFGLFIGLGLDVVVGFIVLACRKDK
jgi:hypothetical protein